MADPGKPLLYLTLPYPSLPYLTPPPTPPIKPEKNSCFVSTAKKFKGGQGGRFGGGGRGRGKRRGSDRQQKKQSEGNEDETLKRTHTRFDEDEPTAKKTKSEED